MNFNNVPNIRLFFFANIFDRCRFFPAKYRVFFVSSLIVLMPYTIYAEELIWPIDSPKAISSSFGEPRPGRFHFGIDFKSGGVTGKKVYALGDGYIYCVRTSPFGYGKALYIRLDDGKTLVYGHLSQFLPEIEDRLFGLRIKKKSYDVEWWPEPNEIRVTKGQVIGRSGDTGGGAPHLHLEIRNENNYPLNPLEHGIHVRDTLPPVIESVQLIPLDNTSSVDGYPVARWFDSSSPHTVPVYLSGRIGIAVSAWDRVNSSKNILGVYHITLAIDSTIVFSKCYDTLPYSLNKFAGLDYLSGTSYGGNGLISALFRRDGNLVDFYEGRGILHSDDSDSINYHTISIRARDFDHNSTEHTVPVAFGKRPELLYCGYNGAGEINISGMCHSGKFDRAELWRYDDKGEWVLDVMYPLHDNRCDITFDIPHGSSKYRAFLVGEDSTRSLPVTLAFQSDVDSGIDSHELRISTEMLHDRIVVRIESETVLASLPIVRVEINGVEADDFLCPVPEGETSWITSVPLPQTPDNHMHIKAFGYDDSFQQVWCETELDFSVMREFFNTIVCSPDSLVTLHAAPGSLYRSAPVAVDITQAKPSNGLKKVSKCYSIVIGDEPLKESLRVQLALESDPPDKGALFISNDHGNTNGNNGNNTWHFVSNERNGNVFYGDIYQKGIVAVFEDTTPPELIPVLPKSGSSVTSRKPLLKAWVKDTGSGIEGSDSIVMSIDGIQIYGEYDYEAHYVSYRLYNDLSLGEHTVKITVTDRVGNARTRSWKFGIRQ